MKFSNGATITIQVLLFALLWMWPGQPSECHCREATPDEVPQGANEYIELAGVRRKTLRGRVSVNGELLPETGGVVEVYKMPPDSGENLNHYLIARKSKRIASCVVDPEGKFCFLKLPPGRYFLVAGCLSGEAGINTIQIVVTIDPKAKEDHLLELDLSSGT